MLVFVEDAAEPVSSADVKLIESACFIERFGRRPKRLAVQGTVMPVLVVEGLELAECVEQVGLVPDQGSAKKLAPASLHPVPHGPGVPVPLPVAVDDGDSAGICAGQGLSSRCLAGGIPLALGPCEAGV
ncbi:MAG: hypothetical protein ACJ72W_28125 [Actinoallomurus sp.]